MPRHDDLPGIPLTLALMLALVALVAVPVALAVYYITRMLPELERARAAIVGG